MMNLNEMKFLIVDDDASSRETIVEFLKSFGCRHITVCDDGQEGLKQLKLNPIDFVISDWEMPGLDGLELLKEMRSQPELNDIPFMMITSPISNEKLKIGSASVSGVDAYMIKPFRGRLLRQKILEVLDERDERLKKIAVVVDDDDMVRDLVAEVLKGLGFESVQQFSRATAGYEFIREHVQEIAVVISDWEMPEMTGIELLHKIRIKPALAKVPFIMITSQTSIETLKIKKAIEAEVDHYLIKPFKVEVLREKITSVLRNAKVSQTIERSLEFAAAASLDFDFSDAQKFYEKVRVLDPKNVDCLLGLAKMELKKSPTKGFEEAIKYIRKAIAINPRYDIPHIDLALIYESAMALDKATSTLQEAQTLAR